MIPPPASPTMAIKAPDLPPEILRKMNHREWMESFSIMLQAGREKRGGVVTPFLQGAIARLQFAAKYVELLERENRAIARDNKLLRRHIEHLGGIAAPPIRPEAEDAADPQPE